MNPRTRRNITTVGDRDSSLPQSSIHEYQLVIQYPASSVADYDRVIDLESFLIDHIAQGSEIDGHDAGSGEINVFFHTEDVDRADLPDFFGPSITSEMRLSGSLLKGSA